MRVFYPLCFLIGISFPLFSQEAFTTGSEGYYTIVGAFAIRENAAKYNASLQKNGTQSSWGYLASQNIYYVYTLRDASASTCLKEMRELRKKPEFWDAWVRYIREDGTMDETPVTEEPIAKAEPAKVEPTSIPVNVEPAATDTSAPSGEEIEVTDNEKIIIPEKITLGNTEIFLSLYSPTKDKVADGVVQVVDTERGRLITEVKGNTYLILPDPKSKSGNLTLICDVFGYRKVQKELNYNNPTADSTFIMEMGTSLIANFEMIRYAKGEVRTLYNVFFFNDAAVMLPESKFELNQILDMMKENTDYRIRLHGHANGNSHGKIILADGDFFSVHKDARTTIGSAKELSESRAGVIKDWLVANGVDASRVEIKAWGGKRPLYDKNSANAKKNIRVEVEML